MERETRRADARDRVAWPPTAGSAELFRGARPVRAEAWSPCQGRCTRDSALERPRARTGPASVNSLGAAVKRSLGSRVSIPFGLLARAQSRGRDACLRLDARRPAARCR